MSPRAALILLDEALYGAEIQRPAQIAVRSVEWSANEPHMLFGDFYERAAQRLRTAGFDSDVRTFRLTPDIEKRTVAVYVRRHDARIQWTDNTSRAVPANLSFRREDRRGFEFTLFSGEGIDSVRRLILSLSTPCQPAEHSRYVEPREEWDPHLLEGLQREEFFRLLPEFERVSRAVEEHILGSKYLPRITD